jgi:hypothetical protein
MDVLNNILGDPQKRSQYDDFISRYEQGSPYDGIGDDEAVQRYQEITPTLSDRDYQDSAEAAYSQLSPQERAEFSRYLQQRAQERGITDFDGNGIDDRLEDPHELAKRTSQARQQDPNILEQLLGKGGTGGPLDNPLAKIVFAGITAFAASKVMGRAS